MNKYEVSDLLGNYRISFTNDMEYSFKCQIVDVTRIGIWAHMENAHGESFIPWTSIRVLTRADT